MDSLSDRLEAAVRHMQADADLAELGRMVRYDNQREMARIAVAAEQRAQALARLEAALDSQGITHPLTPCHGVAHNRSLMGSIDFGGRTA